jgi:hypothetical protein
VWIDSFFTFEGESSDLTQAVFDFQRSLSFVLWELNPEAADWLVRGTAYAQLVDQVEALQAEKQYEGRQLLTSEFRSYDRQSEDQAVVTVRETWQDALYAFDEYPGWGDTEPLAERGPYTLDVTYTLERGEDGRWLVTRIVYANEPPSW